MTIGNLYKVSFDFGAHQVWDTYNMGRIEPGTQGTHPHLECGKDRSPPEKLPIAIDGYDTILSKPEDELDFLKKNTHGEAHVHDDLQVKCRMQSLCTQSPEKGI
jgi:hypothetical protein